MSHLIANSIVRAQLGALSQKPGFADVLYAQHLDLDLLQQPGKQLSAEAFSQLMRACFDAFDDEAMGFTQKPLRTGTFRMLCHSTIGCPNLRRVILRICDFFRLLSDEFHFTLHEQGNEAALSIKHTPPEGINNDYFIGMLFTIFWRYLSWLMDGPLLLQRIYLRCEQAEWQDAANSVFTCPVYYAQAKNQIVFSNQYLHRPVKQTQETLSRFLGHAPECLMSHYQSTDSLSQQVRQVLTDSQELDAVTLETLAPRFSCSAQSLSRKLRQEGHPFQQLKDKVRKSRTIHLLRNSELSIADISAQVGFAEEAVFYRTFKKWTGLTPGAYRQQMQRGPASS